MNDFITEVRNYMARNNLTQGALSRLLRIDKSNVSRWLSGDTAPRYSTYQKFIQLLEEEKQKGETK